MPSASQILLFQSTLLMRGATRSCRRYCRSRQYFNPRSSCEERRVQAKRRQGVLAISIHAPHARSDFHDVRIASICRISIHAPHARSDDDRHSKGQPGNQISIHAPHARSDALSIQPTAAASFQSTLLMRGATASSQSSAAGGLNFNPRSSCEERLDHAGDTVDHVSISIHAPHARSDAFKLNDVKAFLQFQSTLLMRGATSMMYVSPRYAAFQSTLLMRGATTIGTAKASPAIKFQSTLLMRGATRYPYSRRPPHHFNPRSSCEERRHRRSQAQRAD